MTRLTATDIKDIAAQLQAYDTLLLSRIGKTLRELACFANGIEFHPFQKVLSSLLIGVVPIQAGQGIIGNFSSTVSAIVKHIGFRSFVTRNTDVAGVAEAIEAGSTLVMMADDQRFIVLDARRSVIVDNTPATARGFVAGLELMVRHQEPGRSLKGQSVLILGCGPVGTYAALEALQRGAHVSLFDIEETRSLAALTEIKKSIPSSSPVVLETDYKTALARHTLLVEATNASDTIPAAVITPKTYIAAPGMPLGLSAAALQQMGSRLLHDPLPIGVAVMAVDAAIHHGELTHE